MKTYEELELEAATLQVRLCEANLAYFSLLKEKSQLRLTQAQATIIAQEKKSA